MELRSRARAWNGDVAVRSGPTVRASSGDERTRAGVPSISLIILRGRCAALDPDRGTRAPSLVHRAKPKPAPQRRTESSLGPRVHWRRHSVRDRRAALQRTARVLQVRKRQSPELTRASPTPLRHPCMPPLRSRLHPVISLGLVTTPDALCAKPSTPAGASERRRAP